MARRFVVTLAMVSAVIATALLLRPPSGTTAEGSTDSAGVDGSYGAESTGGAEHDSGPPAEAPQASEGGEDVEAGAHPPSEVVTSRTGIEVDDDALVDEAESRISFLVNGPLPASPSLIVLAAGDETALHIEIPAHSERITHDFTPGSYSAGIATRQGGLGDIVQFDVPGDELVRLPVPQAFEVRFQVQDADSHDPVEGATVELTRTDHDDAWGDLESIGRRSGANGEVRVADLIPGTWLINLAADGYAPAEQEVELPGGWAEPLDRVGYVDLVYFRIAPITEVRFQLVGGDPDADLSAFSIAHTHDGEPVAFDAEGRASLRLGSYFEPLYVKVWHPDGTESIRYLDGGLPAEGEAHSIHIGGSRTLEVDLRIAPQLSSELDGLERYVRASYQSATGDAVVVSVPAAGEGVYTFDSVQADAAIASFATARDYTPTEWKTEWVDLSREGTTSCTLHIDSPPIFVRFVDGAGSPVPSYNWEVRQIPDRTTWLGGGTADENGTGRVARVADRPCALCGFHSDDSKYAIDLPIDLGTAEAEIVVALSPTEPTFVEVSCDAQPVPGVTVVLEGRASGFPYVVERTGPDGKTATYDLVTSSRADIRFHIDSHWCPEASVPLLPGRNAITVHETGRLRVSALDRLGDIRSLTFGRTLEDWRSADNLDIESTEGGAILCRVPVGQYEVTPLSGEPVRVDVRKGADVPSGI